MKPKQALGVFLLALLYCFFWLIITVGAMANGVSLIYAIMTTPIASVVALAIISIVIIAVDLMNGE